MGVANGINPTFDKVNIGSSGTNTAITQATSTLTAVTVNAAAGVITMFGPLNLPAAAEGQFDVVSGQVTAKSAVVVNVASGSVGGTTQAFVKGASAGSFTMALANLHASVAETGTLVLNFAVFN